MNNLKKTNEIKINIIQTSDIHGAFFPYCFIEQKPIAGSVARLSTFIQKKRKTLTDDNLFLIDNGDILQGQPISYYFNYIRKDKKNIAASVLNYLRYDVVAIGNHDIGAGREVYDKYAKELNCPIIAANIIDKSTSKPYFLPYYTIEKATGVKVTFIGLTTPAVQYELDTELWKDLEFTDMVKAAEVTIEKVKEKEHPDIIVGLFHSGWDKGLEMPDCKEYQSLWIAKHVVGFDIIFFGHDHTPLHKTIRNIKGTEVLCLNPANDAQKIAVSEITLSLSNHKNTHSPFQIIKKEGKITDISNLPIDHIYMEHFKNEIEEVKQWTTQPIGRLEKSIYTKDALFGSSAFNDLILEYLLRVTNADIAFNAPQHFNHVVKKGIITIGDLFKLYKYDDYLYVMKMKGYEIKKYLEMSYALWTNTMKSPNEHILLLSYNQENKQKELKNPIFNFDSALGIDYEVDVRKPIGEKITIYQMTSGEPFELEKTYHVAVNSYRGNGGGELLTKGAGIPKEQLQERIVWKSRFDQRHYIIEEIKKERHIIPKAHNHWRFIPKEWTKAALQRDKKLLFGR